MIGELQNYTAPRTGYYSISHQIVMYKPTGTFETVKNPNKRWWKFWEPDTIQREVFKKEHSNEGTKVVFLQAGQKILTTYMNRVEF